MLKEKKLHMCFQDLRKAFHRVPRRVFGWEMRKKGIPEVLVRSVMSLYEGANSELSKMFEVKVGIHQECVLSLFFLQLW